MTLLMPHKSNNDAHLQRHNWGTKEDFIDIFLTPRVRDRFLPVLQTNSIHYS